MSVVEAKVAFSMELCTQGSEGERERERERERETEREREREMVSNI